MSSRNFRWLAEFLKDRRSEIVREVVIDQLFPGMTEGFFTREEIARIEVVDFDALVREIDAFSETLK